MIIPVYAAILTFVDTHNPIMTRKRLKYCTSAVPTKPLQPRESGEPTTLPKFQNDGASTLRNKAPTAFTTEQNYDPTSEVGVPRHANHLHGVAVASIEPSLGV